MCSSDLSPNGRLDGFAWKLPLAEIGVSRPVIDVVAPPVALSVEVPAPAAKTQPAPMPEPPPERPARKPAKSMAKAVEKAKPVEPVIPLVHAPDDPGPDSGLDGDPVPEPSSPPARDAWQRLRQLFR